MKNDKATAQLRSATARLAAHDGALGKAADLEVAAVTHAQTVHGQAQAFGHACQDHVRTREAEVASVLERANRTQHVLGVAMAEVGRLTGDLQHLARGLSEPVLQLQALPDLRPVAEPLLQRRLADLQAQLDVKDKYIGELQERLLAVRMPKAPVPEWLARLTKRDLSAEAVLQVGARALRWAKDEQFKIEQMVSKETPDAGANAE